MLKKTNIDVLTELKMQRKYLLRQLDIQEFDKNSKTYIFKKIKEIDKEINYIKFKLELEKRTKNEKYRKDI